MNPNQQKTSENNLKIDGQIPKSIKNRGLDGPGELLGEVLGPFWPPGPARRGKGRKGWFVGRPGAPQKGPYFVHFQHILFFFRVWFPNAFFRGFWARFFMDFGMKIRGK